MSPVPTFSRCPRTHRGLTALELLFTVLIAALLLTLAAPSFQAQLDRQRLQSTAVELAGDVQLARLEALALQQSVRMSFHADPQGSCYLLHTGQPQECACSLSHETAVPAATCTDPAMRKIIKAVALPTAQRVQVSANVASLQFDPVLGTSTPTGTLEVSGPKGRGAIHHVVNLLGRVRSCSPQGLTPGYPTC